MYFVLDHHDGLWSWALYSARHRLMATSPQRYARRVECLLSAAERRGGEVDVAVVERVRPWRRPVARVEADALALLA